jgi:CheY-like chemotaxis protein
VYDDGNRIAGMLCVVTEVTERVIGERRLRTLAQRLRERPSLRQVRFVALTGYGQAEDRRRARAAGFDDHLVKPVTWVELKRQLSVTNAAPTL